MASLGMEATTLVLPAPHSNQLLTPKTPPEILLLSPFTVCKPTWGNAALGTGKRKQGTETRRQSEAWDNFCFPLSNDLFGFCWHKSCFFALVTARARKKVHECKASDQRVKKHSSVCYVSLDSCPASLAAQWENRPKNNLHYYSKASV